MQICAHHHFQRAFPRERSPRKLSRTMIQVYAIYEHGPQRNPKNEERNYENYVDIASRPYRSFEIPFRRMQFGVFVCLCHLLFPRARTFRYCPMMDYSVTSGSFLLFPSTPFFFFFRAVLSFSFFLSSFSFFFSTELPELTQYHIA